MTSLQKKRDQFRFKIRKQHINKIMQQQRKEFIKYQQQQEDPNFKQELYDQVKKIIDQITLLLQRAEYEGAIKNLQYMHQVITQNQGNATFALNNFEELTDFYYKLFENKELQPYEETTQKMYQDSKWRQVDSKAYKVLINICLNFLKIINFQKIRKARHLKLIDIIWKIFYNNSQYGILSTIFSEQQPLSSLELMIIIIRNSISVQNYQVFNKYQQMGFLNQLVPIIEHSQNIEMHLKRIILEITYYYFKFQEEQLKQLQINEVQIIGQTDYNRQKNLMFAIYFIDRRDADQYIKSMHIMKTILTLSEYLTQHIQIEVVKFVAQNVLDENHQLSSLSLQLLNDIIYYSREIAKQLLQNCCILDLIHKKLLLQISNFHPVRSKRAIELCSYIVCNVLLVKGSSTQNKKSLHNIIYNHPIWQLAYQHLNDQSALFLFSVASFEYLIERVERNQKIKLLEGYLYGISGIDFKNSVRQQQCSIIQRTVQRNYLLAAQFWGSQADILNQMLEKYKLCHLIEELDQE